MKNQTWPTGKAIKTLIGKTFKDSHRFNQMFKLLDIFDNPQNKLKNIIHVGGTNGKGSTCNFIKNILLESGYTVNLYTSPHLINFNERFEINGKIVSDYKLKKIINYCKCKVGNDFDISFFEASVLFSFILFNKYPADFNIIEVGLGGRYDATNVFDNVLCSVLTSISLDHCNILGDSVELIAKEKVEIIKRSCPVFTSNTKESVLKIIKNKANVMKSDFFQSNQNNIQNIQVGLAGFHQIINSNLALKVCEYIKYNLNYSGITDDKIKSGIKNTKFSARLEKIKLNNYKYTEFILDGAHNEDGVKTLFEYIVNTKNEYTKTYCIFNCLENKNVKDFIVYIKGNVEKIFVPKIKIANLPKSFRDPDNLIKLFYANGIHSEVMENLSFIKSYIKDKEQTRVIIFGSLYLCGFIKDFIYKKL